MSSKFSFLHRRMFWGVACGLAIFSSFLLSPSGPIGLSEGLEGTITSLAITFGGLFWILLIGKLVSGLVGGYFLSILYLLFVTYLLVQAFKSKTVSMQYPITFLGLVVVGYAFLIGIYGL
jgi:hypothetical protein